MYILTSNDGHRGQRRTAISGQEPMALSSYAGPKIMGNEEREALFERLQRSGFRVKRAGDDEPNVIIITARAWDDNTMHPLLKELLGKTDADSVVRVYTTFQKQVLYGTGIIVAGAGVFAGWTEGWDEDDTFRLLRTFTGIDVYLQHHEEHAPAGALCICADAFDVRDALDGQLPQLGSVASG